MDRIGKRQPVKWYLREWRKHLHLTQGQVAERVETAIAVVSQLENGQRQMNDKWISAFADAFGVDHGDLLRPPGAPTMDELLKAVPAADREVVRQILNRFIKAA